MFTKKTRVISAIAIVCMLLSLMASFCLPAAAESNNDEIVPSKGLVDVSALDDIRDGFKGSVKAYKVTDREGMDIIAKQVARKTKMEGYTFTMANDIDMSGTPFAGIGAASLNDIDSAANAALTYNEDFYTFRGTFDGNGFVFTNLYMYLGSSYGVGLFGNCYNATIKNVGIASGLIVGADRTGSVVGLAHGDTKLINCWNAATVIGGGGDAAGGLVGTVLDGKATLTNCYNLGLVYNYKNAAAGLVGLVRGDQEEECTLQITNSYSAGTLIDGFKGLDSSSADYFGAILRVQIKADEETDEEEAVAIPKTSANNFYLDTIGKPGWEKDGALKDGPVAENAFDGATSFTAEEFSELHKKLNKDISSDPQTDGYSVAYEYSEAGYPVLTYIKDDAVVAKRLPAADAKNVVGNDWAKENALFGRISAAARKNGVLNFSGEVLEIASADDLFIFGLFSSFNALSSNFGVAEVQFTDDVDMDDLTLANVGYYVPIGANAVVDYRIDGKNHTLYNWKSYTYLPAANANAMGGLICEINGGSLKNFSLENAMACYDQYYKAVATAGYTYPSLLLERVNGSAYLHDVTATGEIRIMAETAANSNNNAGLVGRHWGNTLTIKNSWCEATATYVHDDASYVARAIGSSNAAVTASKYENVFWIAPEGSKVANTEANNPMVKDELQLRIPSEDFHKIEIAHQMNESAQKLGEDDGAFWTIGKNGKTKLTRSFDESEKPVVLLLQRYVDDFSGLGRGREIYGAPEHLYRYKNDSYQLSELPKLPGYELDNETPDVVVLDKDYTTVNYSMVSPDPSHLGEAEDLVDTFGEAGGESIENLRNALVKIQNAASDDEKCVAIYEAVAAFNIVKEAIGNGKLSAEYPYLPSISRYRELADYHFTDWLISSKEDWIYATEMAPRDVAALRLHLAGDIDMENEAVWPLAYGATFNGLVDGHGYNFYNFNITQTDPNGFGSTETGTTVFDNSFGLVAHLGTGVIQNIGLASGTVNIKDVCSQDQGIGAFAGVADSGSLIANCWNGLTVNASNKGAKSRIGGIVGRGAGILYGCYNIGAVSGNEEYVHGLNAYASNGGGRFYNCYNLLVSGSSAGYNTAIGQGGSYQSQTTAASTPYQNTYSIGTHLIYGYASHPSAAIVECSRTHSFARQKYDNGFMAYAMNNDFYRHGDLAPVYWTMNEEGMTVFGNKDNAVRRLTITLGGETLEERYVNGDAAFEVLVDNYDISDIEVVSGSALVSGEFNHILTMQGTDVEIAVSVDCRHTGTLTYTMNEDGSTHSWFCSACEKGEEAVLCTHDGEWADHGNGTHAENCACGREFTEKCQYTQVEKLDNGSHLMKCICGSGMVENCEYSYSLADEKLEHRHYCIRCGSDTFDSCTFGPWEIVKAPALNVKGEERQECVCGRFNSREIPELTGAALTLSAPVAYANEEVEVKVNLKGIPVTPGNALVMKVEYNSAIFDYESAVATDCTIEVVGDDPGELKIAFIWPENITEGMGDFATFTFKVKKDAPAGKSVMTVSPYDSSAILNGPMNVEVIPFTGGSNLIDVAAYAWGDANGDKNVTLADVIRILRKANSENITLHEAADVWNDTIGAFGSDGQYTVADATWVLQQLLRK